MTIPIPEGIILFLYTNDILHNPNPKKRCLSQSKQTLRSGSSVLSTILVLITALSSRIFLSKFGYNETVISHEYVSQHWSRHDPMREFSSKYTHDGSINLEEIRYFAIHAINKESKLIIQLTLSI